MYLVLEHNEDQVLKPIDNVKVVRAVGQLIRVQLDDATKRHFNKDKYHIDMIFSDNPPYKS